MSGVPGVFVPASSAAAPSQAVPPPGSSATLTETPGPEIRTFARRADEVPAARRFVRAALDGHPGCWDAELLASELVTNVIQHADDATCVTVTVIREAGVVHVLVRDDGRDAVPQWREATGTAENGRGFHLVNEIAQRWGFLREPSGTCVWFEIAAN